MAGTQSYGRADPAESRDQPHREVGRCSTDTPWPLVPARRPLGLALLAALALPATALAADVRGTPGPDHLVGTAAADVSPRPRRQRRPRGAGRSRRDLRRRRRRPIYGGDGLDVLSGGDGRDGMWGGDGRDVIRGGPGGDWLFGGDGRDVLYGGAGPDVLYGGDNGDVDLGRRRSRRRLRRPRATTSSTPAATRPPTRSTADRVGRRLRRPRRHRRRVVRAGRPPPRALSAGRPRGRRPSIRGPGPSVPGPSVSGGRLGARTSPGRRLGTRRRGAERCDVMLARPPSRRPEVPAMSTTAPSGAMTSEEIVALSREHTFFSWSVQGAIDPIAIDHAEGVYLYTPEGERILDFNSQLMSVNIGHGDRRVIDAITEQATQAPVRPAGLRDRAAGAPRGEAGRDPARRPRQGLLHPRRRRGDRERDQARPPLHRPAQDPRPLPAPTTARRSGR